jgi:tRNA (cytidine/uridine-2'-O-)-methyltransferase
VSAEITTDGPAKNGSAKLMSPLFEVALVEPEIPNNTGNIGRTCVAAGCRLHLVHPLGFVITEKACRRAGLDYWPRLDLREHASWDEFAQTLGTRRVWMFTTKARRSLYDVTFTRGDMLMFGKETKGLTAEMLARYPDSHVQLPMMPGERSLNLATVVCAGIYHGMGQLLASGQVGRDGDGRLVV